MTVLASPRMPQRWPWRGLTWALLAALLAHSLVWKLASWRFSFNFQKNADRESLITRVIEPAPIPLLPPAPKPVSQQLAAQRNAGKMPADEKTVKPVSNPAFARKEYEGNAPESVATIEATLSDLLTPTTSPVSNAPELPGLKLSYPASATLMYEATFMNKGSASSGSGELRWKIDGDNYELSLEAAALLVLSRAEKSEGAISAQGLSPRRYSSSRTGRSEQATHFRPEQGKISFSNNKPDEVLLAGAQDRLSALIQLAGIIGGDVARYKIVNRIPMQVAGLDGADIWEFNLQGLSDITLPAANMQALKLSRTPRNEYDQRWEIWLSPQLGYLPIRIRQSSASTPEQDYTDLVLRKLP